MATAVRAHDTTVAPTPDNRAFVRFRERPLAMRALLADSFADVPLVYSRTEPDVAIVDLTDKLREQLERRDDVDIIPSTTYAPVGPAPVGIVYQPLASHPNNMKDVLDHIQAPAAWRRSRGGGVHIATVDTGLCGTHPIFPAAKRSPYGWGPLSAPATGSGPAGVTNAWTDPVGHGSMTGAISSGTSSAGGKYDGVAPDATLIACRTDFNDTDLYQIYDYLITLVTEKKIQRLVINNSYGLYVCSRPTVAIGDPFPGIVQRAVAAGIVVVFAAGNNHVYVCKNSPAACTPNTIWGTNSLPEVLSTGTVDRNNDMTQPPPVGQYAHCDSSRGPGQFSTPPESKPDCVAPTYGEVVWGCGYTPMLWWGTSGAAPQVTGLAALILALKPTLTPAQVSRVITSTCSPLPLASTCVGAGLINCDAALSQASTIV